MNLQGNTILITGGASGIGLGLAEAFKQSGNEVVIAGRSQSKLEQAQAQGFATFTADLTNQKSILNLAAQVTAQHPALNVVIHNAGIMANEKFLSTQDNSKIATETVQTNLLAPIYLTNALLPHLLKQTSATIMTVTSGIAFVPFAMAPTYSATKAGIHFYTQCLRYQLQGTNIEVKELVPPYVRTSLMGERQANDPNAMPLEEFISEVMSILREQPDAPEILVKRVHAQRFAGIDLPTYEAFFKERNDALLNARKAEWDVIS